MSYELLIPPQVIFLFPIYKQAFPLLIPALLLKFSKNPIDKTVLGIGSKPAAWIAQVLSLSSWALSPIGPSPITIQYFLSKALSWSVLFCKVWSSFCLVIQSTPPFQCSVLHLQLPWLVFYKPWNLCIVNRDFKVTYFYILRDGSLLKYLSILLERTVLGKII